MPSDKEGQENPLRSLMNVRMPKPASEEFIRVQDEYLKERNAERGITDIAGLKPVSSDERMYIWQAPKHIHEIVSKVDYKTLLFFIGLFVVVGGLEQTGILEIAANFIGKISGGNAMLMVAIIIWLSAFASAFVDNIPFAATMIPIIKALAATEGVSLSTLAWALSMGTDIGGSATPIGASANVVGTSVAAKAGHPIGWGLYCKKVVPATILVLVISTVGIFVRYF